MHSNPVHTRPLTRVFLRKLLPAYLILALLIASVQGWLARQSVRQDVLATLQAQAQTFAPGAESALWEFQDNLLQAMVRGMAVHPAVVAVSIHDVQHKLSASWRAQDAPEVAQDLLVQQPLYHVGSDGHAQLLGSLSIGSSENYVNAQLRQALLPVLSSLLLQLLLLGAVFWWWVRQLLVQPLIQFSQQVQALSAADSSHGIALSAVEVAEISTLAQGFNVLMQRVAQSHDQVAQANLVLEQRVQERTQALEAANRDKAHFLALVSHELRSPLTAVKGALRLLQAGVLGPLPEATQPLLESSQRNTDRILNLVNELLDFESLQVGAFQVQLAPVDLLTVMQHTVAALQGLASEWQGQLLLQAPPEPVIVQAEAARLEQVLVNLVANALRHGASAPVVTLGLSRPRPGWVRVMVSNPGPPIAPEVAARLFQPFQQAQAQAGTSGLGLSISKGIIEAHRGQIGFMCEQGQVQFYFDLPADS